MTAAMHAVLKDMKASTFVPGDVADRAQTYMSQLLSDLGSVANAAKVAASSSAQTHAPNIGNNRAASTPPSPQADRVVNHRLTGKQPQPNTDDPK